MNPVKVINLVNIVKDNINTDITEEEYADFIKLADKMKDAKIGSYVLGEQTENSYDLFINPPLTEEFRYKWVLTPRTGAKDFSEIKTYIDCIEKYRKCEIRENGIERITPSPTPSNQE